MAWSPSYLSPSALSWPNHDVPWMSPLMCPAVARSPFRCRPGPSNHCHFGAHRHGRRTVVAGRTHGEGDVATTSEGGREWAGEIAPHAPGSARGSASLAIRKKAWGCFPRTPAAPSSRQNGDAPVPPSPPGARTEDCITSLPIGFWAPWSRPIDAEPLLSASWDLGCLMRGHPRQARRVKQKPTGSCCTQYRIEVYHYRSPKTATG